MLRRIAMVLAAVLLVPLLGIPGWIALNRQDLPDPGDADLMYRVEVPEAEDGYAAFREAAAVVDLPTEPEVCEGPTTHLRWEDSDPEWIEARVRANAPAFALLQQGLSAPAMQIPVFDAHDDDPGDVLMAVQRLVRLAAVEARLHLQRGDPVRALESALLGMRVGRKLSEAAEPNLVSMMVALSDQSISLQALDRLLAEQLLSGAEMRDLVARLEKNRPEGGAWERAWASEYRLFRQFAFEIIEEERAAAEGESEAATVRSDDSGPPPLLRLIPSSYTFQPNRTLHALADIHREFGRYGGMDCHEAYDRRMSSDSPLRMERGPLPVWRRLGKLLQPNAAGRIFIATTAPSSMLFVLKRCHAETRIALVQAMAALLAHEQVTGALPDRLEDLVPDYLPAVPEDRFDGQPLRYAKAQRTVWSVGDDFRDDGPPESPSQSEASEPAVSLAR